MLFIKSKIQFFESKSQQYICVISSRCCCLSSQRYNFLKANHNMILKSFFVKYVVYQVKDTIFWKQITTYCCKHKWSYELFIKSKIQFFESKSQHTTNSSTLSICCLSSQRYNFLKANHNGLHPGFAVCAVVYQVKDTIFWKQITTDLIPVILEVVLFIKSKIQFFESKSQQWYHMRSRASSCLSSQRYNFLKANHNNLLLC